MMKIEKMVMELVKEKVIECGERYKFDGEQAFREMMELKVKEKKIVLPFSKENICEDGCQGLKYNLGLFTQCEKKRKEGEYCGGCGEQCEKSEKGIPECGTVGDRLSKGLMEFRDPKGRSPLMYVKLMKKKGWELEDVKREAENKNWKLDEEHLENTKEKRGRPKKEKKEVESTGITDLFANIVAETKEELIEVLKEEKVDKAEAVEKQKAEAVEKEALKKAQAEAAKEAKEALKEAKQKAAKEAKEALKEDKKADKEAKEGLKKDKKAEAVVVEKVEAVKKVEEVARPKITVSRIEIEGKKYLKSSENILYDPETKEEMGIWNEEKKIIMPLPDDEEEEEEYESD